MAVGSLRYGRVESSEYGETVKWCHWHVSLRFIPALCLPLHRNCVSPVTLRELAASDLENIDGFQELRWVHILSNLYIALNLMTSSNPDKQKMRMAIARGRIDIPAPSQPAASLATTSASNYLKRKMSGSQLAEISEAGCSQPASQREEADEDTPSVEEAKDELYCTLSTKVVGIQYYKGTSIGHELGCITDTSRIGWSWRGSSTRQRASECIWQVSAIDNMRVNLSDGTQEMQFKWKT